MTEALPTMSGTLCQDCEAVGINDRRMAGLPFTPQSGETFLHFGLGFEGDEGHFSIRVGGDREDEFPDLPGLRLSAANGCSLCGLLRSAVLSKFPPEKVDREGPDASSKTIVLQAFKYHWDSLEAFARQKNSLAYLACLSMNVVVRVRDKELSRLIFFEVGAPSGPLATWLRIPWNFAHENPLSPGRIRDIKSWISDCEQNCHHIGITETLPTRLIDVGSEDGKYPMRLILSSDIQTIHRGAESCKYATLSYCWGDRTGKPFFTTEKSTLLQLLQSIPMGSIPCTFRDAVVVTRSLGIRYLWIDALCIVQDDSEDWAKESAVMGRIYTNSYVTLIALHGESCHGGLLDRKTAKKVPIYYKSSLNPHFNGIYWLRQVSNDYVFMRRPRGRYGAFAYDTVRSRWNSRGWTLQEKHLSTRKLMFGAEGMYYDCGKKFHAKNWGGRYALESWSILFLVSLYKDLSPKDVHATWYEVVSDYSNRNLTYSTDRLPAISGLAEKVYEKIGGNYLAGLWQSDLINGLLWTRTPWDRSVTSRATFIDSVVHPKHYIAPSWSWARSQQCIRFVCRAPPYVNIVSEIEVLEARTDLTGPNPFGGVQGGHLLLRGKTFGLQGARIFGVDGEKVDIKVWMQGSMWLEVISHNGSEIARCALDWQSSEALKDFDLCEAPWDQSMMLITASHSIGSENSEDDDDNEDSENEEGEEEWEADEDEEDLEDDEAEEDGEAKQAEEDEEAEGDKNEKRNERSESDNDDMDEHEDRQSGQDGEDNKDGEGDKKNNSSEKLREYFGLLLLPKTREANSWVRVGVCMLRSDIHGRTVLDNWSEKTVKLV